jgi:hypothetical protein
MPGEHHRRNDHHQYGKKYQQLLTVHDLAQAGAAERPDHPGDSEDAGASPLHRLHAGVRHEVCGRIHCDGERGGADGDVNARHTDNVDHQRHCEDGAAAAHQAERKPHERARQQS